MNFNIYLSKDLGSKISHIAKAQRRSHNSIISEALEAWIRENEDDNWPSGFFDFEPIDDVPELNMGLSDAKP